MFSSLRTSIALLSCLALAASAVASVHERQVACPACVGPTYNTDGTEYKLVGQSNGLGQPSVCSYEPIGSNQQFFCFYDFNGGKLFNSFPDGSACPDMTSGTIEC